MLLWTYLWQFSKPCLKFFGWKAQNLLPKVWKWQNKFFFSIKNTPKMSLWKCRVQFRQHCGKMLAESMKKLYSKFKLEKIIFLRFLHIRIFLITLWTHHRQPTSKGTEKVEWKVVQKTKTTGKLIFGTKSGNFLVDTKNAVEKTLPKFFC